MKRKCLITIIFFINCLLMFNPWFQGIHGLSDISGTLLFNNPIAITCMLMCMIGIWVHQDYGHVIVSIGWIGMVIMEIYEFLTWHIRLFGGSMNISYSQSLTYSYFYYAVLYGILSYLFYFIIQHYHYEKVYHKQYSLK